MKIPSFNDLSVLVFGDVMLDRYLIGATQRISPEAPVPIVLQSDTEDRLGGAANVALNLASLGVDTHLSGALGKDNEAGIIEALLAEKKISNHCYHSANAHSIVKLRITSRNQQLLRVDTEKTLDEKVQAELTSHAAPLTKNMNTVVLSDYNKGALHAPGSLIKACNDARIPVLVDPKGNDFTKYKNATMLTPNMSEFELIVGECSDMQEVFEKGERLRAELNLEALVVTMSEKGVAIIEREQEPVQMPTRAREVYDVTGAGDTMIASLAACTAAGQSVTEATKVAMLAAAIVVGKAGTATVSMDELNNELIRHDISDGKTMVEQDELLELVKAARAKGERIVMTNGCFDLLHPGHLAYLQEAASEGDRLVVAVNSDESVRGLKGDQRPINPLKDRMEMLAGIKGVDWVCAFAEETPRDLIAAVLPDVLIKGGDYKAEEIAGYEEVKNSGGEVKILSLVGDHSSTRLIDRIRDKLGT